ncbi:MAG: aminodeoxychorismate/anthranilate synthase component II [Pseudomonadota bacterium]
MILIIDNYDSFVETLARYLREAGAETRLVRNDALAVDELLAMKPSGLLLSPGPKTPSEAGVCLPLLAALDAAAALLPVLGVCLGHQAMVEQGGGATVRAVRPLHGEASLVRHDGDGVFAGAPSPMKAGRYHSLIARLPATEGPLRPCAWADDGELMAVRRNDLPWHGVQFHPESLLTEEGALIMENFAALCRGEV